MFNNKPNTFHKRIINHNTFLQINKLLPLSEEFNFALKPPCLLQMKAARQGSSVSLLHHNKLLWTKLQDHSQGDLIFFPGHGKNGSCWFCPFFNQSCCFPKVRLWSAAGPGDRILPALGTELIFCCCWREEEIPHPPHMNLTQTKECSFCYKEHHLRKDLFYLHVTVRK